MQRSSMSAFDQRADVRKNAGSILHSLPVRVVVMFSQGPLVTLEVAPFPGLRVSRMSSDRARWALQMRREGAKYSEIAEHFSVTTTSERQLVMAAAVAEARRDGHRQPTEGALEAIKYRRKHRPTLPSAFGSSVHQ